MASDTAPQEINVAYRARGMMWAYFVEHVMEPSDGCRDWPHLTNNFGYGLVQEPGQPRRPVNVAACERWHGPKPFPGAQAAHSCGRPICWAGEHLRWATPKENVADQRRHGTLTKGSTKGNAKLTEEDVIEMRRLAADGVRRSILAARFGVSVKNVWFVVTRRTWTHI